jgi:hypothetical protein
VVLVVPVLVPVVVPEDEPLLVVDAVLAPAPAPPLPPLAHVVETPLPPAEVAVFVEEVVPLEEFAPPDPGEDSS